MPSCWKVWILAFSLVTAAFAGCTNEEDLGARSPASDGGTTNGDGSATSPSPDLPKDDGGAAAPFHSYAIGHKRTWQGKNEKGRDITDTSEVTGILEIDGRSAFVLSRTTTRYGAGAPSSFTSYVAVEGDNEWSRSDQQDAAWEQSQKAPLTDGASWTVDGWTYSYKREAAQTVPAGTFDDCWRIMLRTSSAPGQINDNIVCRGVGLVRETMSNPSGASLDLVLAEKNF